MSRKGDCWDDAVTESFFATLVHELLAMTELHSRHEGRGATFEFIEVWYNRERMHSTPGYLSPVDYDALQQAASTWCRLNRVKSEGEVSASRGE